METEELLVSLDIGSACLTGARDCHRQFWKS